LFANRNSAWVSGDPQANRTKLIEACLVDDGDEEPRTQTIIGFT
jgi:hypothetical protein